MRKNAVLALAAIYKLPKGELLVPDAPELVERMLQNEQVGGVSCHGDGRLGQAGGGVRGGGPVNVMPAVKLANVALRSAIAMHTRSDQLCCPCCRT